MYKFFFKNIVDRLLALLLIVATLIFTIPIIGVLFFMNHGKVFFIQQRPGKNGKPFNIIKFKTMNDKKDDNGNLLPELERITTVGKWLRKLSLDETPQFINVLKGDLSLIGPRPLLMEYLPLYDKRQQKRHIVKPGMSGWSQVNTPNSWKEKLALDVYYVEHISFKLDALIFFKTLCNIFRKEESFQSFEKFKGS